MPEFDRKKLIEWLFAIVLIILTTIATSYAVTRREYKKTLDAKPSKEYVDSKDADLKESIEKGDANTMVYIKQHEENQKQVLEQFDKRYETIDHKLDILLGKK